MDNLIMFTVKIIVIIFVVSTLFGFVKETIIQMGTKGKAIGEDLGKRTTQAIPILYNKIIDKLAGIKSEPENKK